ncbi:MAG: 2-C-methyl-D-erythritol 4-phosphate cytidylyltransferase [Actinobacteria bacterium]|nr:2-C-methyl-D-erythritol 4-phosphate cytidylyltransferase [Actinomycetota bacterium]
MEREEGKQFLPLVGKPVLAHALTSFQQASLIDSIIVVTAAENFEKCLAVIDRYNITKFDRVVIGGDERQDSVYSGLLAATEFEKANIVVVHDGARPLVEPGLIDKVTGAIDDCDGAIVGTPAKDTIKLVREGYVVETLDRAVTWQVQTPQVFRFDDLLRAHDRARAEGYYGTDDSVLVERAGGKVKIVPGSDENIKITMPSDLVVAEAILKRRTEQGEMRPRSS